MVRKRTAKQCPLSSHRPFSFLIHSLLLTTADTINWHTSNCSSSGAASWNHSANQTENWKQGQSLTFKVGHYRCALTMPMLNSIRFNLVMRQPLTAQPQHMISLQRVTRRIGSTFFIHQPQRNKVHLLFSPNFKPFKDWFRTKSSSVGFVTR